MLHLSLAPLVEKLDVSNEGIDYLDVVFEDLSQQLEFRVL